MVVSNAAANPSTTAILKSKESVLDKLWEVNVKTAILLLQVHLCYLDCNNGIDLMFTGVYHCIIFLVIYFFSSVPSMLSSTSCTISAFSSFIVVPLQLPSQDAAPHLSKGSSVVFISSIGAYSPASSMAMYGVTKTALLGLTKVVLCYSYSVL